MVLVFLVSQTMDNLKVDVVASSKSAEWIDKDCITRKVTTTQIQNPPESYEDFCTRHNHDVAAGMEEYGVKGE